MMEVCFVDGDKIERRGLTTDEKGRGLPASLLRETDTAGYEVCRYGNRLARMLAKEVGCTVVALNPGDLRIIWKRRTCGTRRRRSGAAYRFRARMRRRSGRTSR
jgi:hypothetical protein